MGAYDATPAWGAQGKGAQTRNPSPSVDGEGQEPTQLQEYGLAQIDARDPALTGTPLVHQPYTVAPDTSNPRVCVRIRSAGVSRGVGGPTVRLTDAVQGDVVTAIMPE